MSQIGIIDRIGHELVIELSDLQYNPSLTAEDFVINASENASFFTMETSNSLIMNCLIRLYPKEMQISEFSKSPDSISIMPFAAKVRPHNLQTFYGQEHLISEQMPLRLAIDSGDIHSMILWGPPGVGKPLWLE